MDEEEKLLERITIDPKVLVGKPCIRGMRISVEQILESLAVGRSHGDVIDEFDALETEDIKAVLLYAKELVKAEEVYPVGGRQ